MKKDDWVNTPRFCKVRIKKIFQKAETARKQGFHEPTYYSDLQYDIWGKHTGKDTMIFAAIKK